MKDKVFLSNSRAASFPILLLPPPPPPAVPRPGSSSGRGGPAGRGASLRWSGPLCRRCTSPRRATGAGGWRTPGRRSRRPRTRTGRSQSRSSGEKKELREFVCQNVMCGNLRLPLLIIAWLHSTVDQLDKTIKGQADNLLPTHIFSPLT